MDSYESFQLRAGSGFSERERGLFFHALKEAVPENAETDAFMTFEDAAGEVWTLILLDPSVRLIRVEKDEATVKFVGPLRGHYSETFTVDGAGWSVALRFGTEQLPRALELKPPERPGRNAPVSEWQTEMQRFENTRAKLREWADASSTG